MSTTLLILAAGMGSRYGGLKQLDSVGPSGETLLDYSIFDAIRAGFTRVVFVIRRDFDAEFRAKIGSRYENRIDVDYVYQGLDTLPAGCSVSATRTKPLGTGHAIWCARDAVKTPFAAINADDFYGADAYRSLAHFFAQSAPSAGRQNFAMVGYRLDRTLSDHGTVARGVCATDSTGHLQSIIECVGIEKAPAGARYKDAAGEWVNFSGAETVSMNFFGFTPAIFSMLEAGLIEFLNTRAAVDDKAEYYIPSAVAGMMAANTAQVKVLTSSGSWFGVTYRDDKPLVTAEIAKLVAAGEYPASLSAQ
ncbi:MAG: NTP transferase domain-containing protein [Opitutus sp.]|nr:NTP transferase domain-containing protein [Opitutus sp.]MCS6246619.1 NTP transferase domain-containing protein [Opitutus sp.]MCS6274813.1 NTP transferase domain-containing protein [Opitutus sp.]MCS6276091.1 NTP transferase domain-containing protein [Opitutus sp.]MCS6301185.1 NTP transferase domain-containing protein [Opitutus sp.]